MNGRIKIIMAQVANNPRYTIKRVDSNLIMVSNLGGIPFCCSEESPRLVKNVLLVVVPIVWMYGGSEDIGELVIISFGILLHVARRGPLYEVLDFERSQRTRGIFPSLARRHCKKAVRLAVRARFVGLVSRFD